MKLIKLLFSKIFISALALILQLVIIVAVMYFFEWYFVLFQLFSYILGILILLGLFAKKEPPDFKLPWVVILLVLPFFGIVVYILFSNSKMSKKQCRVMTEISECCDKFININENYPEGFAGIENYLEKTSYSRGCSGNRVKYFPNGERFYADLLYELERAERFIFMEYFIIDRGEMWNGIYEILKRKAAAGVEVRVMYDDIGCAGLLRGGGFITISRFVRFRCSARSCPRLRAVPPNRNKPSRC